MVRKEEDDSELLSTPSRRENLPDPDVYRTSLSNSKETEVTEILEQRAQEKRGINSPEFKILFVREISVPSKNQHCEMNPHISSTPYRHTPSAASPMLPSPDGEMLTPHSTGEDAVIQFLKLLIEEGSGFSRKLENEPDGFHPCRLSEVRNTTARSRTTFEGESSRSRSSHGVYRRHPQFV
ncbi:hypothetical protein AVEN_193396-1 [Araneus ventricosus]|uniref:Uncharacterized protein n=1 Tax=Araneus ventricosus TaxID=182803 RepID=A0A4Y2F9G4_ARAVE|nr:hypothetical protein AVEN_193396-1 [Araneus ventricosus]